MARIAFYSHDTFGLGHLRRCLKLIRAFSLSIEGAEGILITGSPWSHIFTCPPGFRIVRLPPILKRGHTYRPLREGTTLTDALAFRSRRLQSLLLDFSPDLLIVDNVPCGLRSEMLPAMRCIESIGRCRTVLALRDVLDRPDRVRSDWQAMGAAEALASLYDEVWIFGDSSDADEMAGLPGMSQAPTRVCGRIGVGEESREWLPMNRGEPVLLESGRQPRVLVSGGGGGDAMAMVSTYVEMLKTLQPKITSRIVLGPDFPHGDPHHLEVERDFGTRVDTFVPDLPAAMVDADVVVAMAGYNTICEIEAVGRRSVLVPRVWPREEQLIRARKQELAGRAQVVLPGDLHPEGLWRAIQAALAQPELEPQKHSGAMTAAARAVSLLGRSDASLPMEQIVS